MSDKLALARHIADQARELVAASRIVTVKIGDSIVQAQAVQKETGVQLTFMADTPIGPIGGTIFAPQPTFENMLLAARMSDVLPRIAQRVDSVEVTEADDEPRFLLTR